MAGDQDAFAASQIGPGQQGVPVANQFQVYAATQGVLHRVRQLAFVAADRFDVDDRPEQVGQGLAEVEGHTASFSAPEGCRKCARRDATAAGPLLRECHPRVAGCCG